MRKRPTQRLTVLTRENSDVYKVKAVVIEGMINDT